MTRSGLLKFALAVLEVIRNGAFCPDFGRPDNKFDTVFVLAGHDVNDCLDQLPFVLEGRLCLEFSVDRHLRWVCFSRFTKRKREFHKSPPEIEIVTYMLL